MAAATIVGSRSLAAEATAPDAVLLGFMRLCRQLERPVTEAELRATVTQPDAGVDLATLSKLAKRCGFGVKSARMSTRELARLPPPFLILGRQPRQAWLVRERRQDELMLVDPAGEVPRLARSRSQPGLATASCGSWRRHRLSAASGGQRRCAMSAPCCGRSGWPRWSSTCWRWPRRCS